MDNELDFLSAFNTKVSRIKPSDFAEKYRYMGTAETRWSGRYSFDLTPYLREVVDCLMPDVPVSRIAVMKAAQIGFALDVNTPIMTTVGWKLMADIKKGDYVFDETGNPTMVTKATSIMTGHECFNVTFTDGNTIACDGDHLWTIITEKGRTKTICTRDILKKGVKTKCGKRHKFKIANAKPVVFHPKKLPIDPYLLGIWIGDGHRDGNRLTCLVDDAEQYAITLKTKGIETKIKIYPDNEKVCHFVIVDTFNSLKGGNNLYGKTKHIPEEYFTASIDQRLELIQGLIDTDGCVSTGGHVEYYSINEDLIKSVRSLIESVGYKVTLSCRLNEDVYTKIHPTKRYKVKPMFRLSFTGHSDIPVVRLPRKAINLSNKSTIRGEINWRWIKSIDPIDSIPVKCISVNSQSHLYLAGTAFIPTHNSTGVIENAIPWIISQYPSNILLMAADDELVRTAMTQKIDPAIDSCGVRNLIGAHTGANKAKNQRTGDTEKMKEFHGGRLLATSVKSANKMRQFSAKYGFLDDLDSGKAADEREGSLIKLVDGRFTTFGDTAKIFYISTPVTKQTSLIEPLFLRGDQRYYFLPCPLCGEFQRLQWSVDIDKSIHKSGKAGIVYEQNVDTGIVYPETVGYRCEHCGGIIDERHKYEMNLAGEWRPTATPTAMYFRSYHISGLYAPPGAYSWSQFAQDWCDIWPKENGGKPIIHLLKTFKNICLGQTFEEQGRSIDVTQLAVNTRNEYQVGVVPYQLSQEDGNGAIVLITIAADLNGTVDDARLDYLVVGWSESGTSYAIDHGSIGSYQGRKSKKDDQREVMTYRKEAQNNVWDVFWEVINKQWSTDDGKQMKALFTGVDTGFHTVFAYDFIDRSPLIIALKGQEDNKFTAYDSNSPLYKQGADRNDLYILQSNRLKDLLAERISLLWHDKEGSQPVGFMNFPQPKDGKFTFDFFNQYAGERRDVKINDDGTAVAARWVKKHSGSQNHFWDCELYNMAVREIFVNLVCAEQKIKKPTWHTFVSIVLGK